MRHLCLLAALVIVGCSSDQTATDADELVVYSSRNDQLIRPIVERYQEETGTRVRYLTDSDGALIARLSAEASQTPADILMTVDAGNLWRAAELDLLAPMQSETVARVIPSSYRDAQMRWTALSLRARTMVYSTERVDPEKLSTYAALADEQWKGRLCLRTSKKVYNQSLVASMIQRLGEKETEAVVRGWVDNLATQPFSNDTAVIEAIASGQCDVGLVNTYYFGRIEAERPDLPVALFWANQSASSSGVHVNVSGAGITRASDNKAAARAFIEWLVQGEAQALFSSLNMEYPANPDVTPEQRVRDWGRFRADTMPVAEAGRLQTEAVKLMDRVGYR